MNLKKYDNKRVRFIDYENNIIEGISEYYTKEMADAIYGIDSECLKITCFLFRKEEINNITIIDEFTNPYSRLEEIAVEDGMDLVDEILYSDKVRINLYYLNHYSFKKDIQMILCTVLGKKMMYNGELI